MIGKVSEQAFRDELDRILQSRLFTRNPDYVRLLRYLAQKRLQGAVPEESKIALDVYNIQWLPGVSNVRTYSTRLNDLLAEYYAEEGYAAPVILSVVRYIVLAEPNRELVPTLAQIDAYSPDLSTGLASFYTAPDQEAARCVVTGLTEEVVWHYLDFDPYNSAIFNRIPLHRRLWRHLEALHHRSITTVMQELAPARLADELAPKHFRDWRVADAYACTALAFYLGAPRYCNEEDGLRLLRLCDVIHYARHRFFEPLMHQVIQQMVLPFLIARRSIHRLPAFRMGIQLTALLEETGYYEDAQRALLFASGLFQSMDRLVRNAGSRDAFVVARRSLQLRGERLPDDSLFDEDLLPRAQEHIAKSADRSLTLQVIRAHRWLRQKPREALDRVHELLAPIVETHDRLLFINDELVNKPKEIAAADLSEIFLLASITYCRLQPSKWKGQAEEYVTKAKRLMYLGGHILPTEYAQFVATISPSAKRILQLAPTTVRPTLREAALVNIRSILNTLEGMLILG